MKDYRKEIAVYIDHEVETLRALDKDAINDALNLLLETMCIAFLGTVVGAVISVPFAFLTAQNLVPKPIAFIGRLIVMAVRTIPSFIYGLMFISVTGPGPAPPGVFDLLHFGHFELFRRIRELVGENGKVYVMLQIDEMIAKYKPGCKSVYDFTTRQKMIETLRTVDKAMPYDVVGVDAVKDIGFDILVVGPEHTNERFQRLFKWCAENGKEVITLPRTEGISTTKLKALIKDM